MTGTTPHLRVVKLGGSLLEVPNLPAAFWRWENRQPPLPTLIVAGGGAAVTELRKLDDRWELPAEVTHQAAIDMMSANSRVVAAALGVPRYESLEDFKIAEKESNKPTVGVFDPRAWLDKLDPLPYSWDVSSDSIAGVLAIAENADELCVLKSAAPPADSIHQLCELGYLDSYFSELIPMLPPCRFIDLRHQEVG